jgi:hypothetical protein
MKTSSNQEDSSSSQRTNCPPSLYSQLSLPFATMADALSTSSDALFRQHAHLSLAEIVQQALDLISEDDLTNAALDQHAEAEHEQESQRRRPQNDTNERPSNWGSPLVEVFFRAAIPFYDPPSNSS